MSRKLPNKISKDNTNKFRDQQPKIESFIINNKKEDGIVHSVETNNRTGQTSSSLKRKTLFEQETNHESKSCFKQRKVSCVSLEKKQPEKTSSDLDNGDHNKTSLDDVTFFEQSSDDIFNDIEIPDTKTSTSLNSEINFLSLSESDVLNAKMNHHLSTENKCNYEKKKQLYSNLSMNNEIILKSQSSNMDNFKSKVTNDLKSATVDEFEINEFFDDWCGTTNNEIDLSCYKRCQVFNIDYGLHETIVTIKEIDSDAKALVRCMQFWKDIKIFKNQICSVKAVKDCNGWIIDNNNGFMISDPDSLLAGTTIVGGLFCARRSVLQEVFNGLQTLPHYEPDALTLTTGIVSHEIMQEALQNKIYTMVGIKEIYEKKLSSDRLLNILYANNLTISNFDKHTQPYLKHIFNFIKVYIKGESVANIKKLPCSITNIKDIEENIWLPTLGLKGKIDLTATVKIHSKHKIMPIEIKTGRPTFSIEHRGQVMLYILMMNLTGKEVDSGLLLYLKDNIMQEIKGSHQEMRDLILLRNNLNYYFSNKLESLQLEPNSNKYRYSLKLPDPINHRACEKCPFNTLCCAFLSRDENLTISEDYYLKTISDKMLSYLTSAHIDYVLKWSVMLQLEQAAEISHYPQSSVWTLDPKTRGKCGICISSLKIIGKIVKEGEKYIHIFTRNNNEGSIDFNLLEFVEDEYVIVSTDDRVNIAAGKIKAIESNSVTLVLNKNIFILFPNDNFHIDKYSSSSLIGNNNYGNLGGLLDDHENCARLRNIVIDRNPATFSQEVPSLFNTTALKLSSYRNLNAYQQKAVKKAISANDYLLIKGMPGTGKTQTVTVLIELLVNLGKSVLVTANSNSAVDNILLKLLGKNIDFIRLGSVTKIHPLLHDKCELIETANCKTPELLHDVYCSKMVVGVTCYSATHPLLAKRSFDVCIVDESTQVLQPTILRPLYSASKFVLVGDPKQLPPIARSNKARELGLNKSLFERLDSDNNTVSLRAQYRMNNKIMDLANKLTYDDKLLIGDEKIANAVLNITDLSVIKASEKWVQNVLSVKLEDSVIMIDTAPTYNLNKNDFTESTNKRNDNFSNVWEIAIIIRVVDVLIKSGINKQEIGIISPYRLQVACLKKNIHSGVEINTVDQYQGRDKEVIIYSCSKSQKPSTSIKQFELLQDHSRLTVAVTRAKHKLIIIGDKLCLEKFSPFEKLFKSIDDKHIFHIKDGENDFSWMKLIKFVQY